MSEQETRPSEVEKLPSLDDLIGTEEAAETIATSAALLVLSSRRVEEQRISNQEDPDRPVRGFRPEPDGAYEAKEGELIATDPLGGPIPAKAGEKFRTYEQQRDLSTRAFNEHMQRANAQGILRPVTERTKVKIKEMLEREQRLTEAQVVAKEAAAAGVSNGTAPE